MTSNQAKKARGIILAALMVFSVFAGTVAFAGTAAAQEVTSADRTISSTEAQAGDTVEVTIDVELSEGGGVQISDTFDSALDVEIVDGLGSLDNTGDGEVTFNAPTGTDSSYSVTYAVTIPEDAAEGTTYDFSGTAQASNSASIDGDSSITVVADGGDGEPEPEPEPTVPDEADAVLSDGLRVWSGQTVYDDGYSANDQGLELQREVGDNDYQFVTQITVDENGTFLLDTSQYATDSYRVIDTRAEAGDTTQEVTEFEISTQTYSASADPATVANAGDTTTDFVVDSNRVGYTHVLDSEDVDAETIQALVGGLGTLQDVDSDDANELLIAGGTTQDVVPADFEGVDAGNYTIDFTVLDTGVTASTTVTVEEGAAGDASFVTKAISEERGDVVPINVSITGTATTATVQVGGPSVNYNEVVTVSDEDEDGNVEFFWNTYLAGTGSSGTFTTAADDDDTVTRQSGSTNFDAGALAGGEYPVNVSVNDAERDIATIVLNSPSDTDNTVRTWTAPDRKASLDPESDDYIFGQITVDDSIAENDWMVVEVGTAGVYGQLAAAGTGDLNALSGTSLTITQTDDSTPVNTEAVSIDTSNAINVASGATNTVFVLVDTAAFDNFEVDDDTPVQEFEIELAYDADEGAQYRSEDAAATSTFTFVDRTATFDAPDEGRLSVQQSGESEVTGTASVAPGTELTVTARSSGGQNPFLRTATATVQDDGTWTTTLDLSDVPTGTNFSVSVKDGSQTTDSADAQIAGAADLQLASLDAPESATVGQTITVTATVENTGGTEGTEEVSFVFEGETLLTQSVTVGAGSTQDVTFEPTLPSDAGDYTHGVQVGDNEVVTAGITVEAEDTTTEPTTTEPTTTEPTTTEPTTTEPTTTEPTTEMPDTDTATEDNGGSPGFGVAVALVALLAAALLATRRDN